jgi:hypothetical protein
MLVLLANVIAHLTCAEFAHILGAFPLAFPEDAQGGTKQV